MKTRQGFVSNSSSSSFLVAFPHRVKSVEELQRLLFGDAQKYMGPYEDHGWDAKKIAEIVWRDLKDQSPSNLSVITEELASGYVDGMPEWDSFHDAKGKMDWDAFEKAKTEFAKAHAKKFADLNPETVIFSFEYSDNDGDMFSAMEHGTLFDKLPHLRISNH